MCLLAMDRLLHLWFDRCLSAIQIEYSECEGGRGLGLGDVDVIHDLLVVTCSKSLNATLTIAHTYVTLRAQETLLVR